MEEEPENNVDGTSLAYIFGGIPALVLFIVVLFWGARACNWPA
jgi:hypothetical protein